MAFDANQYKNDFERQNYDRVVTLLPKGKGQELKELAKSKGKSVTQVVVEALENQYGLNLSK